MTVVARAQGLTKKYGSAQALTNINLTLEEGLIYGLAGRNGSGKTTLLAALVGQVIPTSGSVELFGTKPSGRILARTHFQRTHLAYPDGLKVRDVLRLASLAYPAWNETLADTLIKDFALNPAAKARKLSDGQASALGIIVALASRAELTLMDEPYSGLDPVARTIFYDRLLTDFALNPRTIVLSTHLLNEIAPLLDRVLMLRDGALVLDGSHDEAATSAHEIAGSQDAINVYLARTGLVDAVARQRAIGSLVTALLAAPLTETNEQLAVSLGVHIQPVSLQDSLAVHSDATYSPLLEPQGGRHD